MRALVLRGGELRVDEVPEPSLGPGHVLLETIACGICGTDLHCRHHGASFVAAARRSGLRMFDFDPEADLVMGHELSGRVLACGEGVEDLPPGTLVTAHPLVRDAERAHAVGFSNVWPGGYAERVVVHAAGVLALPAGTDGELAALTEPLAVGLHAVNQSRAVELGSAIVVGCGPVGLAVVTALRVRGVPLVVATDLSPTRRRVANQLGAHVVVDPTGEPAVTAWRGAGGRGPAVLFEAVGVPGRLDALMREAPSRSQIVVVGVCMEPDRIEPSIGIMKQQTISFALGWTAEEFRESLHAIGRGDVDAGALVTGRVGLDGAAAAFDELGRPEHHVKILVVPGLRP
jgi:threonine dehydrogenase-like Zn-dependent dehydrogenase